MVERIKARWGITSNFQFIIIMLVFAVTGSSVLIVKEWIYSIIGVSQDWGWWVRFPIWLATILPSYYVLLLIFATIFGQREFFWGFTKKSFSRFSRKKDESATEDF